MQDHMLPHERIRRIIDHKTVDRIGLFESFWWETVMDWFSPAVPSMEKIEDTFGLDAGMYWFDQSFLLPSEVVEEDEEARIIVDEWGARIKESKDLQSTSAHLGFSLQTSKQWQDEYKERLVYDPERIDWEDLALRYETLREHNLYTMLSVLDPLECTQHMVGPERQFALMGEDVDWLIDMYAADTALLEAAFEDICERGYKPDALWLYGDVANRSGLLFPSDTYKELLFPFHKRICDLAHRHGCQVIYHSDGNVNEAIPLLLEAGIDCLHPLEVKAGMDIFEVKKQYGDQLALMGNIDARLFQNNDLEGLENEIRSKVAAAMEGSGYIFHSDHSIPPETHIDTYNFARKLALQVGRYS